MSISKENIKFITYKLLKGLEFLHVNDIAHGSLRPDEIFIYKNG